MNEIKQKYKQMTIWQLIPDKFVNNSNNHYISNALADMYLPPIKRFKREGDFLFTIPEFKCSWEIHLSKKNIKTYLVMPTYEKDCIEKELNICWPTSTIKEVSEHILFDKPVCQRLTLKYHSCFGLNSAKNNDAPLDSIFEVAKYMKDTDNAIVQILLSPLTPQYYQEIIDAHEQFKAGNMPTKLNGTSLFHSGLRTVAGLALDVVGFISVLMSNCEPKYDLKSMMPIAELSEQSKKKARGRHFKTEIRICAEGERQDTILKSLYLAFRDMDNDNRLIQESIDYKLIKNREFQKGFNKDILCTAEVEKLIQLPTRKLQMSSPVEHIGIRECPLPKSFFDTNGIPFGYYQFRGKQEIIYWPSNQNDCCRVSAIIGPQGSGKSEKGANFGADAIRKGQSIFVIDPAQGTLCNSIRDSLPKDFPADHIIDLNLGNYDWPIPVHWHVKGTNVKAVANLMANNLIAYLNKISSEEMGDRTKDLTRSAAKVIFTKPGNTLLELKLMFRSQEFCKQMISGCTNMRMVDDWNSYWELAKGSQQQYSSPVISRINSLINDDFIANSILQRPKQTDLFKWLNGDLVNGKRIPYCVLLRMPKDALGEEGLNAIATYWVYAIWLAVLNRNPLYTPISWLIMDEPHQYLGGAEGGRTSIWGQLSAECRKWGLGVQMLFQSWEQIPTSVRKIMKDTGTNISLFNTDKDTFNDLKEMFAPYELEDFLEIPQFHTINRIMIGREWHVFISKCFEPPIDIKTNKSWRYEYIDRSDLTNKCHRKYGRHIDEVEKDIYERESILYKNHKKK